MNSLDRWRIWLYAIWNMPHIMIEAECSLPQRNSSNTEHSASIIMCGIFFRSVTAVNRRRFSRKYFARVTIVPKIVMQ